MDFYDGGFMSCFDNELKNTSSVINHLSYFTMSLLAF